MDKDFAIGKLYKANKQLAVWNIDVKVKPDEVFAVVDFATDGLTASMEILLSDGVLGKVLASLEFLKDTVERVEA